LFLVAVNSRAPLPHYYTVTQYSSFKYLIADIISVVIVDNRHSPSWFFLSDNDHPTPKKDEKNKGMHSMPRRKTTIEELLKKVNHQLYVMLDKSNHSFLYRLRNRKVIGYLQGESYALAWALNKVEPYGKKKFYYPGPKRPYCSSSR
jgi:hypothetical protein